MSLDVTLARIVELQTLLVPAPRPSAAQPASAPAASAFATTPQTSSAVPFAAQLQGASAPVAAQLFGLPPTTAGQAVLNFARGELGVAEQPPGSNDSPRIAQYRQATAGAGVGPWCAYFTSWAAREAGVPLGELGQGFGRVDDVYAWAQRAGKAIPNVPGVQPQPGDLIVWDEHIGIVDSVGPDGTINTIEGNSSDQVSARSYAPGERPALGYVRLG